MIRASHREYLADAIRWVDDTYVDPVAALTAGIGMSGPVLLAAATGDAAPGLAAALGSLMIGGIPAATTLRDQARQLLTVLVPAVAATVVAAVIAGHGWLTDVAMIVLVALSALLGGLGRLAAVVTTLFNLYLIIVLAVAVPETGHLRFAALVLAGSLWTIVVGVALGAAARWCRRQAGRGDTGGSAHRQAPRPTRPRSHARWRRSLRRPEGWQFPIRLAACLGIAVVLRWLWPDDHLHWIALTVALLSSREIEAFPVKLTQRALGTALGVAATSLLLLFDLPGFAMAAGIGVLAAARPMLRARNYLAYSAVMTPLVVVVMDAGRPLDADVLIDRLVATLIGAGLVIAANAVAGRLLVSRGMV